MSVAVSLFLSHVSKVNRLKPDIDSNTVIGILFKSLHLTGVLRSPKNRVTGALQSPSNLGDRSTPVTCVLGDRIAPVTRFLGDRSTPVTHIWVTGALQNVGDRSTPVTQIRG